MAKTKAPDATPRERRHFKAEFKLEGEAPRVTLVPNAAEVHQLDCPALVFVQAVAHAPGLRAIRHQCHP